MLGCEILELLMMQKGGVETGMNLKGVKGWGWLGNGNQEVAWL